MSNNVRDGILGLCVADALGVPVEFKSREYLAQNPVTGMMGYGTYNQPAGTWSDDTSMTLCLLDSLAKGLDYGDIMSRYVSWLRTGEYTPYGEAFDIGNTTRRAMARFAEGQEPLRCGGVGEHDNGNGSLMRILPAAFYVHASYGAEIAGNHGAMELVHDISSLTHGHKRSHIACGFYIAVAAQLLDGEDLVSSIKRGTASARGYYQELPEYAAELEHYERLADIEAFAKLPESQIRSGGYVVDTLEAAVWCLLNTDSYKDCVLRAVNLGGDTDTVAAVAGGIAGLYYGCEAIPEEWLAVIERKGFIEELCVKFRASLASQNTGEAGYIIIHPEYRRLIGEITGLKSDIVKLLEERDALVYHTCKNIEADYMIKIGALEYKVFEFQCKILRLKRKIELVQSCINRQETVCLDEIEKQLDIEYEAYIKRLQEKARMLDEAMERAERWALSEDETAELKRLYRNAVKRMHPDINPNLSASEKELFRKAVKAYQDGDLDMLRTINILLTEIQFKAEYEVGGLEELRSRKKELATKRDGIIDRINAIKSSFPYNQREFLRDRSLVREKQDELTKLMDGYKETYSVLNNRLQEIMGDRDV